MTTAFVLSGGGSLGSVQVGMLLALADRGITPDLVIGTSVGALNAAWIAGRPGLEGTQQLAKVWSAVGRGDIFPTRPWTGALGLLGRANHTVPSSPLRSLLRQHLNYALLEDAPIPVRLVATEVTTGQEVVLARGDAVDAVSASAALPGVFPPVRIDGQDLMDGGVVNNTPISHAVDAGASTIYVLPSGYACALARAPGSALGMVLQAVTLLMHQRLFTDVGRYQGEVRLRVPPPLCPLAISPVDFSHTTELITRARVATSDWLDTHHDGEDQTHDLRFHHHREVESKPPGDAPPPTTRGQR